MSLDKRIIQLNADYSAITPPVDNSGSELNTQKNNGLR